MTSDVLLFGAFPYVAMALFLVVSIQRYRKNAYTVSSLSSQFLEAKQLFWGSVPFHLGITVLFFGHLIGFLIPRQVALFGAVPLRLLIMEVTGLTAGLLALWGCVLLMVRRMTHPRLRVVTSPVDKALYALLLFQIVTGLWVALFYRWGSAWYVQTLVPYLRSVFTFQPNLAVMAEMKLIPRLHVIGAFTLIAVFPFTRLMHVLVAPLPYLWRRPQLVLWNRARAEGAPRPGGTR